MCADKLAMEAYSKDSLVIFLLEVQEFYQSEFWMDMNYVEEEIPSSSYISIWLPQFLRSPALCIAGVFCVHHCVIFVNYRKLGSLKLQRSKLATSETLCELQSA
ncbi:hypothetical protein K1719_010777 [Acacia pycnantha]|nr:hypothetical protein K1719_010777 [Acacia pycnantha]